jgi:hypothetical protein
MSTIYDALKKVETKTKPPEQKPQPPKRSNPKLFLLIYFICAIVLISLIHFLTLKSSKTPGESKITISRSHLTAPSTSQPAKPQPLSTGRIPPTARKLPSLSLTGIFFSDGEYIALINNETVKVGDTIEGVQIQKIDSNGVEIKFGDSSFRLNFP